MTQLTIISRRVMQPSRGLLRLLLITLCLSLTQSLVAVAQTKIPAPLPPAAQEALDKGIIAAKVPDYLLAIRYFEEARKLAPQAPVIYLNMGIAESKIPSRELRAMAWFGAYLSAYPDAPNAAAVKETIGVLAMRNQSNVSRFLKTVQDTTNQISGLVPAVKEEMGILDMENKYGSKSKRFLEAIEEQNTRSTIIYRQVAMAKLWIDSGDMTAALKSANLIYQTQAKDGLLGDIASAQLKAGDIAGAQNTTDLIQTSLFKCWSLERIAKEKIKVGDLAGAIVTLASAQKSANLIDTEPSFGMMSAAYSKSQTLKSIASAQANAGDIAGAQKTADLIENKFAFSKSHAQSAIAEVQLKSGDIVGAQKTLASAQKTSDLIQDASDKSQAQQHIANAKAGMTNAPNSTRPSAPDIRPSIQPDIKVSDWLKNLDSGKGSDCPLNTEPFLDLAGYLKSLPTRGILDDLQETAKIIVTAQNTITRMLKQQAKK